MKSRRIREAEEGVEVYCSKCCDWWTPEDFTRQKKNNGFFHPWCRACVTEYGRSRPRVARPKATSVSAPLPHPSIKLPTEKLPLVLEMRRKGAFHWQIAAEVGVKRHQISKILRGRSRKAEIAKIKQSQEAQPA